MDDSDRTPRAAPSLGAASLVLVGLAAVTITQPMLDILGRHAEFFVAGRYGRRQIVALSLIVAWAPAAGAIVAVAAAGLLGPRVRRAVYSAVVAALAMLFALVVLRDIGVDRVLTTVPVAIALGLATVAVERRSAPFRTFLKYLAAANVFFLVSFLFFSRSSDLLLSPTAATGVGGVDVPRLRGPVVVVILDEFPLTTLLRPDGSLNDQRFANFARLSGTSTWFRNASSLSARTHTAVPEMLTGRVVPVDRLPTYREHPRNLLTLLGNDYPVHRYEVVTDLCPPTMCDPKPPNALSTAVDDSLTIYGHLTLPASLRDRLPQIDHTWGNFGDDMELATPPAEFTEEAAYGRWENMGAERSAQGQYRMLVERGRAVTEDPAVHLIHVALPHYSWTVNHNVHRTTDLPMARESDDGYDSDGLFGYQLHTMQAGAADRAIGELIDHLERRGIWEDALVAVMSDHGSSLSPPDLGRTVTVRNREEVLRVPMFVKAPGQTEGVVRDDVAMTIDLLPSIVDLLDIRADWEFDGHSLYDGSSPKVDPAVSRDVEAAFRVARSHAARVHGDDWIGLVSVGDHHDLVGRHVADIEERRPSGLRWSVVRQAELADLPAPGGAVPFVLAGRVTSAGPEPPQLVVAVNGRIAGTIHEYKREDDGSWHFDAMLADFFVEGVNAVEAFEVERTAGGPVLHRLATASP